MLGPYHRNLHATWLTGQLLDYHIDPDWYYRQLVHTDQGRLYIFVLYESDKSHVYTSCLTWDQNAPSREPNNAVKSQTTLRPLPHKLMFTQKNNVRRSQPTHLSYMIMDLKTRPIEIIDIHVRKNSKLRQHLTSTDEQSLRRSEIGKAYADQRSAKIKHKNLAYLCLDRIMIRCVECAVYGLTLTSHHAVCKNIINLVFVCVS